MDVGHQVFTVLYGVSVLVCIPVGVVLLCYRRKPGAVPLSVAAFSVIFWPGPLFVASVVDSYVLSEVMARLTYVGVGLGVVSMFLFALEYTGREHLVNRRTVLALSVEPVVVVVLAFTNPNATFFTSVSPSATIPTGVVVEYGTAFYVHIAYSYLLLLLVTLMMLELLYTSTALYRGQAAAIFGGTMFPSVMNAVRLFGVAEADVAPIGFILAAVLFSVAIVRYRLADLVPIARDSVLDTVTDGIVVIDRDDRIVDTNQAARQLFDAPSDSVVGTDVASAFEESSSLLEEYRSLTETPGPSSVELSYDDRYFDVRARPIEDARGRHVGRVLVVADVTERKRREQRLEAQNDRLEEFASLVSHDLRNPLNVADGYVELARETGDTEYLAEVELCHTRMETIIEDVLTLAREGEAVTDPEPVEVGEVARRAWEHVDTGDAELRIRGDGTVCADADRLARLLENLYRNAVEHGSTIPDSQAREETAEQAPEANADELTITVSLESSPDQDSVGLVVEDDGVGIDPEVRDRIFEHGYTSEKGGTGLGLSIVERIADAHGWQASVGGSESGGARFVFEGVEVVDGRESVDEPATTG